MPAIAIADIQIVDRHRADLGDIAKLAESMSDLGQLQPIVVTSDLRLVAGERRLAAARLLDWADIEARIVDHLNDAAALLRAERDENTCRKAFTPTEEYSLYEALLALEDRPTGRPPKDGKDSRVSGRAKESVAEIVSGNAGRYKTLDKVGEVKRLAEDVNQPERVRETARDALTEMDRTGNVAGPHSRVKLAAQAAESSRGDIDSWSADERDLLKRLRSGETVVVSFREHHANVVHWAQVEGLLVSVDRRTEWGNPFVMPHDGDRDTVIANYEQHYLPHKPSLMDRVGELHRKALACWCAPEPCHADVLKRLAEVGDTVQ